jgi:RNA polymerase sigma-70 factor (ECF subfamily)
VNGRDVNRSLVERLYRQAKADRWSLPADVFADALQASADRAFAGKTPDQRELERYLASLHLDDLALACACAAGHDAAWEQFVLEQRPLLYRSADALDPGGGARELADSLYADLYGLPDRGGERHSLFRYFHGRSTLATWLRAVLAQRHVDRMRVQRRFTPLPDEESSAAVAATASRSPDPDRPRYLALIRQALDRAVSRLNARDRLRLGCYYAQELTLAQTARLLGEHEATVSRQLARTRRSIREAIVDELRAGAGLKAGLKAGLSEDEIARCFECAIEDAGPLDLRAILGETGERKDSAPDRSI